jgi:hypothetical protein
MSDKKRTFDYTYQMPLDETPLTLTLPAYQWAILRGAARSAVRRDLRRSDRRQRELDGVDLNVFRADALEGAVGRIEAALAETGWKP